MTPSPHTISAEQNLVFAQSKMNELGVRHLPVLRGGQLIGILSDRDIRFIESFDGMNPEEIDVEDACTYDPYIVDTNTSLKEVCQTMAEKKYGCTLVKENGKLAGIFTWIDALKVLSTLC
ncbi:CBS domain-containing protein [Halobacteriovorax sp. HLS]|uniref:CBS domain-containing protein n=1 Tax=Halobacteriovorax sp. HLS TaxID=2234000 RepID=UPI0013E3A3C7|nr:CBS domain-containing protein [Halobacteriovorax sp. HLS]